MNNALKPQFDYYAIIPHPLEERVLLLSTPEGWTLPSFKPVEHHVGVVDHLNRAINDKLGVEVTTLRCVYDDYYSAVKFGLRVYAMDNHSPEWMPLPGGVWLAYDALHTIRFVEPVFEPVLEEWFAWRLETSPLRVPWSVPGWFDEAVKWIHTQLERLHLTPTGPVEQIRAWVRSCTLRVETSEGAVYFKAVPPVFAYEPVITRVIGQLHPGSTPEVLAVDVGKAWMLLRDMHGQPLKYHSFSEWEEALQQFSRIQRDMTGRISSLIAIGCPNRNLDQLVSQIESLLSDPGALFPGTPSELTDAESKELRRLMPQIQSMCYKLMDYRIPLTLQHGDLVSSNIIFKDGKCIYFDWSDSAVTHPFFDLLTILTEAEAAFPKEPDVRERLLKVYLKPWTQYAPMEHLLNAVNLALPLAALHQALIYHRVIIPSIETRAQWEQESWQPYYLRMLLKMMKEYSAQI